MAHGQELQTRTARRDITRFFGSLVGLRCSLLLIASTCAGRGQGLARRPATNAKEVAFVSPEAWSTIAVGIVILVAIATSNRAMRRELGGRIDQLSERIDQLNERFKGLSERVARLSERFDGLNERVARLSERVDRLSGRVDRLSERFGEMSERIGKMGERLGRVEGLLEGLGLTQRRRAGKEREEGAPGRALPQP